MNDHSSAFAHAGQEPVSDINSILACLGWHPQEPAKWRRHTAMGTVRMCRLHASDTWLRLAMSGGYITVPSTGRYLHHNGLLPAPLKFVRDRQGVVECRVDVPQPTLDTDDGRPSHVTEGWEPLNFQVVRAITQLVDGCESPAAMAFDPDQVVAQLTQLGRSASRDGERVLVHVGLPGAFGQIRCEHDARIGPRLAADLLTLDSVAAPAPGCRPAGGGGQPSVAAGAVRADRDAPHGVVLRSLFGTRDDPECMADGGSGDHGGGHVPHASRVAGVAGSNAGTITGRRFHGVKSPHGRKGGRDAHLTHVTRTRHVRSVEVRDPSDQQREPCSDRCLLDNHGRGPHAGRQPTARAATGGVEPALRELRTVVMTNSDSTT